MQTDAILTLYEYNYRANDRILAAAAKVTARLFEVSPSFLQPTLDKIEQLFYDRVCRLMPLE